MDRPWWCGLDGARAAYDHASLDPLHPFGVCSALVGPYRVPAHGGHAVPLVATEWERDRVLNQAQAARQRKAHARHIGRRLVKSCRYCNQLREALFAVKGITMREAVELRFGERMGHDDATESDG